MMTPLSIDDDEAAENFFRSIGIAVTPRPAEPRRISFAHFVYAIVVAAVSVGIFFALIGGKR